MLTLQFRCDVIDVSDISYFSKTVLSSDWDSPRVLVYLFRQVLPAYSQS